MHKETDHKISLGTEDKIEIAVGLWNGPLLLNIDEVKDYVSV
mgnify:CR=1 FL=1